MRILFTGASSFTGAAFVQALTAAGHEVVATFRGERDGYQALRGQRVAAVEKRAVCIWSAPFGGEAFFTAAVARPFDLLCHHAAQVGNYRSASFDALAAAAGNTTNLPGVLTAMKEKGLAAVVLTGTVFEADEGLGEAPRHAFSPYGLSKTLTTQIVRYWCAALSLPLGRFVIPNPFGPFEEQRFCGYLVQAWQRGEVPRINTPDYIRDNIPIDLLAACYAGFASRLNDTSEDVSCAPSGYVESQGAFGLRMSRELGPRLGLRCNVDLATQVDFSEPTMRVNPTPAKRLAPCWNEVGAWDRYAHYLQGSALVR